jgi:hypothetical protein
VCRSETLVSAFSPFNHNTVNGMNIRIPLSDKVQTAMTSAKTMTINPRVLSQTNFEHLNMGDLAEKLEITGPGFIKIHLRNLWLILDRGPDEMKCSGSKRKAHVIAHTRDTANLIDDSACVPRP